MEAEAVAAPKVDFYVLPDRDREARLRFACRLAEKAWLKRHRVRVQLEPGELETFDQMLWTFADRSFLPHRRAGAADDVRGGAPPEVVIADSPDADAADGDVLVNLAAAQPARGSWARIAEVVDADDGRRRQGRERFRAYRDLGLAPETHEMGSEA
jgi:DNA polymerase-3 subunit chi